MSGVSFSFPKFGFNRKPVSPATPTPAAPETKKSKPRRRFNNQLVNELTFFLNILPIVALVLYAMMPRIAMANFEYMAKHTEIGCMTVNLLHEGARKGRVFAHDEPEVGLIAMAQIVENRFEMGFHQPANPAPTSRCDVVWEHKQFSWTRYPDTRIFGLTANDETVFRRAFWAATQVMFNQHKAQVMRGILCDAAFYYNPDAANPDWDEAFIEVGHYGNHRFMIDTDSMGDNTLRAALRERNCPQPANDNNLSGPIYVASNG